MPFVALTIGHPRAYVRRGFSRDFARGVTGRDEDDHLRAVERRRDAVDAADVRGQHDAGQVARVLVAGVDRLAQVAPPRPEDDVSPFSARS